MMKIVRIIIEFLWYGSHAILDFQTFKILTVGQL